MGVAKTAKLKIARGTGGLKVYVTRTCCRVNVGDSGSASGAGLPADPVHPALVHEQLSDALEHVTHFATGGVVWVVPSI